MTNEDAVRCTNSVRYQDMPTNAAISQFPISEFQVPGLRHCWNQILGLRTSSIPTTGCPRNAVMHRLHRVETWGTPGMNHKGQKRTEKKHGKRWAKMMPKRYKKVKIQSRVARRHATTMPSLWGCSRLGGTLDSGNTRHISYTLHFTPIKIENVAWSNVAKGSPGANNATWDRGTSSKQDPNQVAILRLMPMMTTEQEVFPQKVRTKVASVRRHMLASGYSSYKKAAWKASWLDPLVRSTRPGVLMDMHRMSLPDLKHTKGKCLGQRIFAWAPRISSS